MKQNSNNNNGNSSTNNSEITIPKTKTLKQVIKYEIYLMDNREFRNMCRRDGWFAIFTLNGQFVDYYYGGASGCYSVRIGEGGVYTKKDLYKKICEDIDYDKWIDAENERRSQE